MSGFAKSPLDPKRRDVAAHCISENRRVDLFTLSMFNKSFMSPQTHLTRTRVL